MGAAGSEARRRYGGKFKGHNCLQPTIAFALSARKAVDPSDTAYAPVDGAAVLADALIRGPISSFCVALLATSADNLIISLLRSICFAPCSERLTAG